MVYPRLRENPGSTRRFTSAVMDDLPGRVSLWSFSRWVFSFGLVETVEHAAVPEVLGRGVVPVLRDGGDVEALDVREIRRVLRQHRRIRRAVEVLRDDLLALWRVEKLEIRLRNRRGALVLDVLVDPCDVGLRQDAGRGIDDLDRAARFLHLELRLVLPRQVHVADALLDERDGRPAGAQIEHRGLRIQLL